jgi:hypothetical protein
MKKGVFVFIGLALILLALILFLSREKILMAPPEISQQADCTEANIKLVWEAMFKESSEGILVLSKINENGFCEKYFAYKILGENAFMLYAEQNISEEENRTSVISIQGDFTQIFIDSIPTFDFNANFIENLDSKEFMDRSIKPTNIALLEDANAIYSSIFIIPSTEYTERFEENQTLFTFLDSLLEGNNSREIGGFVSKNYSIRYLIYDSIDENKHIPCITNWTRMNNTSCTPEDSRLIWYADSNYCNTTASMPSNYTLDCDNNANGIIDKEIGSSNADIKIYINNALLNDSRKYNQSSNIKLKEGNLTLVEFTYPFAEPFNLRAIELKRQTTSSGFGYTIINGVNVSKTIKVAKKDSRSDSICLEEAIVSSIGGVSDDCDESNEELINCPGESESGMIECEIINNTFVISGVQHSAVKEYLPEGSTSSSTTSTTSTASSSTARCNSSWQCTTWTACTNNIRVRQCVDTRLCANATGRPPLNESCVSLPLTNVSSSSRTTLPSANSSSMGSGEIGFIIIIIILSALAVAALGAILYLILKKEYTPRFNQRLNNQQEYLNLYR